MRVNIGSPVVRTDGRAYGHVITKFSRMGRLPHFLSYGAPSTRALRARVELRYHLTVARAQVSTHQGGVLFRSYPLTNYQFQMIAGSSLFFPMIHRGALVREAPPAEHYRYENVVIFQSEKIW